MALRAECGNPNKRSHLISEGEELYCQECYDELLDKIGNLEVQIKNQEDDFEAEKSELENKIAGLEQELEELKKKEDK